MLSLLSPLEDLLVALGDGAGLAGHEEEILARASDPTTHYIDKIMPVKMRLYVDSLDHHGVIHDIRTIVELEDNRVITFQKLEAHRNRHVPDLKPAASFAEYKIGIYEAVDHIMRFLRDEEIFTVGHIHTKIIAQPCGG